MCVHSCVSQARAGIEGVHVRTLAIRNDTGNRGLAISPDGTRLAVSNYHSHEIAVYSLPDGALLSEFGGQGAAPGRFNYPQKMCFSPADGGNLFIADAANNRLQARFDFARSYVVFTSACSLQEMTSAGAHVRVIGEGLTYDSECGITASADIIAVTTDGSKRVCLFDMTSGDVIRTFGDAVSAEGRLSRFAGIRFTPDGRHILIAEYVYKRLCLFTLDGAFVCYIGEGTLSSSPMDVDFAANGDILVAGGHRICVLSPDGSSLLRTFGSFGDSPGLFKGTYALAMHGGQLYVLDSNSARVQVFT